jgi:tyrosyl-tRNA synthetase
MAVVVFPEGADVSPSKRVKFGIDPTFPRLHLGHFVPLRLLRQLHAQGHEITIVLGTFTAQLGDPSGRDTTRPILSPEEVMKNATSIFQQVDKILGFQFEVFWNHLLHEKTTVPTFLNIVSNFTLAHMTSRNAFADRIENGHSIGMHELLVPICQGLDSVHLRTEIEVGGQDQLFNFGIARRLQEIDEQKPQACMMLPIINGTDGRKMSKSLGNCIFLDEHPNDIFGKVMSIPDQVMMEWWPLLCESEPVDKPIESKKILARSIVEQIHNTGVADAAVAHFEQVIQNKVLPEKLPIIEADTLLWSVCFLRKCSKTEARRLIEAGAVRVDDAKIVEDCFVKSGQIVKVGNRHFGRVQ